MRTLLVLVGLITGAVACSKDPRPNPAAAPAPSAAAVATDDSPRGLCARVCTKTLACVGAAPDQLEPCITSCAASGPIKDKVEALVASDCDAIIANLRGQGGAATPPSGNGCTADCRGCVGDGTSCFAAAGGTNGIPCDACCCAPGGPAPTWRNQ
jgi:hypothetical protein